MSNTRDGGNTPRPAAQGRTARVGPTAQRRGLARDAAARETHSGTRATQGGS